MRTVAGFRLLITLAAFSSGLVAKADTLFSLTGNGQDLSFSLPEGFTQSSTSSTGFSISDVSYTLNGTSAVGSIGFDNSLAQFFFGSTASVAEGSDTLNYPGAFFLGDQLFTGTPTSPTFLNGSFTENASFNSPTIPNGTYIMQISSTATPEPSSLLFLGTGAIGIYAVARRRFLPAR